MKRNSFENIVLILIMYKRFLPMLVFIVGLSFNCTRSRDTDRQSAFERNEITVGMPNYPKAILYYLSNEPISEELTRLLLDPLVEKDLHTWKTRPLVAASWSFKKNGLLFRLDPRAHFHDGHPITAEDVKFTFDTIQNPAHFTTVTRTLFHDISGCRVQDDRTIVFAAAQPKQALELFNRFFVLPKHTFEKGDFNSDFAQHFLGSGPYRLASIEGRDIVIDRDPSYWGNSLTQNKSRYFIGRLRYRFIKDSALRFEALQKGDIDTTLLTAARQVTREMQGEKFEKNYILTHYAPSALSTLLSGIAFNLKSPLFRDVRVRRAMAHLYDRQFFNRLLFDNQYRLLSSYIGLSSAYSAPSEPIRFDSQEALRLLRAAGWRLAFESGGRLVRTTDPHQKFTFTFIFHNPASARFLTIYKETLRKVGIEMNLEQLDWATLSKRLDEKHFDATYTMWSSETIPNLRPMWHSEEAEKPGSFNFLSYRNRSVDHLIEEVEVAKTEPVRKRLIQKIDRILQADIPIVLGWARDWYPVAVWNRFNFGPHQNRFAIWYQLIHTWKVSPEKARQLSRFIKTHKEMPGDHSQTSALQK